MTALERWTEHESAYCESGLCEWSTLQHLTALREVVAELRTAGLQLAADSATESVMKDAEIERLRAAINDLVALIKEVDAEANNVQLDIARVLRRHHMDA